METVESLRRHMYHLDTLFSSTIPFPYYFFNVLLSELHRFLGISFLPRSVIRFVMQHVIP
jgi:hypothetical protein